MSETFQCPKCQCLVPIGAEACGLCGFDAESPAVPKVIAASHDGPESKLHDVDAKINATIRRPHGGGLMKGGIALIILALLLTLVAAGTETARYGEVDIGLVAHQALLTLAAGGVFQLGLVLALAGAIVRAIWFLPGDDSKRAP
jgi:hypothetical protein